jgi:hypothetical protein
MKVRAIKTGYFGKLRNEGDEFEVPEGTKGSWLEEVKQADKPEKAKKSDKSDKSDPLV